MRVSPKASNRCSAIEPAPAGREPTALKGIKRFYKEAKPVELAEPAAGGHGVVLDGRAIKTPAKAAVVLPKRALAAAVAEEWAAQGEQVVPASMPLTSLVCTAIDVVAPRHDEVAAELAGYGETDLICYRAGEPAELVSRQTASWQPLADWAAQELDAPLAVTSGLRAVPQPAPTLAALKRAVAAHGDFELTALASAVQAAGSLIVGLALSRGRLSAEAAFEAAELDATYQMELWGEDEEALQRRAAIRADMAAAERMFELLRD